VRRTLLVLTIVAASVSSTAIATPQNRSDVIKSIMTVSRASGVCSVYRALVDFQEKNDVEGGKEFISQFVESTIEKKGMTATTFMNNCTAVDKNFANMQTAADNMK